jgi:hypothetical protein
MKTQNDSRKPYFKPGWEKKELFERFTLSCTKYNVSAGSCACKTAGTDKDT